MSQTANTPFGRWCAAVLGRQEAIAKVLGVNKSLVNRWCTGEDRPSLERAPVLASATLGEVSVLELLYPEGLPELPNLRWGVYERKRRERPDDQDRAANE